MKNVLLLLFCLTGSVLSGVALPSEITIKVKLACNRFIVGERIRAVVDVANASADTISAGYKNSKDRLILELYRAQGMEQFDKKTDKPFVAPFILYSGEGQKLETFISDYFSVGRQTRYLIRAVLIHDGIRYESSFRSFDIVPGITCGTALQMFSSRTGLNRDFELVHWERDQVEHLFLKVRDSGVKERRWNTTDLGPFLRVSDPKLSVLKTGEIIVLHRTTQTAFIRSVFWSLPDAFEFHEQEVMTDPDFVGTERVKEIYREAGSVEPVKKAWWKFW